jgi:hypothetical protein
MKAQFIKVAPRTGLTIGKAMLFAGLLFVGWKYKRIAEELGSLRWPSVVGVVESSHFYTSTSSSTKSTTTIHHGEISYRYSVDNNEYVGSRYDAKGNMHTGLESRSSKVEVQAKKGSKIEVFYDPNDPSRSLLRNGISEDTWVRITFSTFLLLVGLVVISYQLKRLKAEQS